MPAPRAAPVLASARPARVASLPSSSATPAGSDKPVVSVERSTSPHPVLVNWTSRASLTVPATDTDTARTRSRCRPEAVRIAVAIASSTRLGSCPACDSRTRIRGRPAMSASASLQSVLRISAARTSGPRG